MSGRFFLDTNVFVYSFDAGSPKKAAQSARLIKSAIETRGGIVYLTGQVATDLQRDTAVTSAQQVPGVERVVNSIALSYSGR